MTQEVLDLALKAMILIYLPPNRKAGRIQTQAISISAGWNTAAKFMDVSALHGWFALGKRRGDRC